jgi:hypothetical protein
LFHPFFRILLEQNTEWLIDGIIRLGSITLLSGESGGGKTWLAYAIAGAVARGWAFADLKVQQRPTLYLDGENPLCVAKQRLFDLGIPETNGLQVWGRWVGGDPPPGPDSAIIREFVQRHRPLLIWNSLIDFHDGDEQSASETRKFMKQFRATGTSRRDCSHSAPHRQNLHLPGLPWLKRYQSRRGHGLLPGVRDDLGWRHLSTDAAEFQGENFTGASSGIGVRAEEGILRLRDAGSANCSRCYAIRNRTCRGPPGSNQSQIVALALRAGIAKHQVEDCLKNGPFNRERGNRNEWLYTVAAAPNSQIPGPIEEGNREIDPSLLR